MKGRKIDVLAPCPRASKSFDTIIVVVYRFVPPQIHILIISQPSRLFSKMAFGKWTSHEGRANMGKDYILSMMSKGHCSCLTSFEDIGKTHSMRNGDLTSLDNEFTLGLHFPASITVRNESWWSINHLVPNILLLQFEISTNPYNQWVC